MAKIYVFLAEGFEEIEALTPVDILRRCNQEVAIVSTTGHLEVTSSHGVTVKADILFEDASLDDADVLLLPGGMPGSANLNEHEGVRQALLAHQTLLFMQVLQDDEMYGIEGSYRHEHLHMPATELFQQLFGHLILLAVHEVLQDDIGVDKYFHIRCRIYRLMPPREAHQHCCWNRP